MARLPIEKWNFMSFLGGSLGGSATFGLWSNGHKIGTLIKYRHFFAKDVSVDLHDNTTENLDPRLIISACVVLMGDHQRGRL